MNVRRPPALKSPLPCLSFSSFCTLGFGYVHACNVHIRARAYRLHCAVCSYCAIKGRKSVLAIAKVHVILRRGAFAVPMAATKGPTARRRSAHGRTEAEDYRTEKEETPGRRPHCNDRAGPQECRLLAQILMESEGEGRGGKESTRECVCVLVAQRLALRVAHG